MMLTDTTNLTQSHRSSNQYVIMLFTIIMLPTNEPFTIVIRHTNSTVKRALSAKIINRCVSVSIKIDLYL